MARPSLGAGTSNPARSPLPLNPGRLPTIKATCRERRLRRPESTSDTAPVWAPASGLGKVKVVSVYFDVKHQMESNHAGLAEGDGTCFLRAPWEDGPQCFWT